MKLAVDTNILFSFFTEGSYTHKLLTTMNAELLTPEYALQELDKYRDTILERNSIDKERYSELKKRLASHVMPVATDAYENRLQEATRICHDPDDIDFFALALAHDCALWSNDQELKEQDGIIVFSTADIASQAEIASR